MKETNGPRQNSKSFSGSSSTGDIIGYKSVSAESGRRELSRLRIDRSEQDNRRWLFYNEVSDVSEMQVDADRKNSIEVKPLITMTFDIG